MEVRRERREVTRREFDFRRLIGSFCSDWLELNSSCSISFGVFMKQDLSIGDRVQISTIGASRCPRLAGKTGIIVGRSIYANSVSVRFDGNKTTSTFHRDYLQLIVPTSEHVDQPS